MPYDWTRFTKRIDIKASPDQLYDSWTTSINIESWFLREAAFTSSNGKQREPTEPIEAGDLYTWMWHGWPDEVAEKGKIVEANGKDLLQFTFGGSADSPMIVTVNIKKEEGVNLVELTQENIPTDENSITNYHLGCMEGWTFYLVNLKSILEGGIDLRNRNNNLQKLINK